MEKHQYLAWLATRSEPGTRDREKCEQADALIKRETLANLHRYLILKGIVGDATREYVEMIVSANFGSVETDDFLMKIKAYPEWMG